MKSLIILILLLPTLTFASCPKFTDEQERVMQMAYVTGYMYDRGYTLAAIAWKESFIGKYIIRTNTKDGAYGSWGVTHIQLTTAMEYLEEDSSYEARSILAPLILNNDAFALDLSMQYLLKYKDRGWFGQIMKYNGTGQVAKEYAEDVVSRVNTLLQCHYFEE